MKAHNIQWQPAKRGGFITADIELLSYQMWLPSEPSTLLAEDVISSFEINYDGLNEQQRKPVIVTKHHSEVE